MYDTSTESPPFNEVELKKLENTLAEIQNLEPNMHAVCTGLHTNHQAIRDTFIRYFKDTKSYSDVTLDRVKSTDLRIESFESVTEMKFPDAWKKISEFDGSYDYRLMIPRKIRQFFQTVVNNIPRYSNIVIFCPNVYLQMIGKTFMEREKQDLKLHNEEQSEWFWNELQPKLFDWVEVKIENKELFLQKSQKTLA
jgi:hypothetical protein